MAGRPAIPLQGVDFVEGMAVGESLRTNSLSHSVYVVSSPAAKRACKSPPTRRKPSSLAAARTRSAVSPPALSSFAIRRAALISSIEMFEALSVAPSSFDRSRTGGLSACSVVNQKSPSQRRTLSAVCAFDRAIWVAATILFPAFSLPNAEANRRAASSKWIGPSA